MKYYRRKLLLSIIAKANGIIDKMSFQKLLFLICNKQNKPTYDFVPYKYGCFSFTANADLTAMVKHGYIKETETTWALAGNTTTLLNELTDNDRIAITAADSLFSYTTDELLQYTYSRFPYYAKNSLVASRYITVDETTIPQDTSEALFTIGYEGISLEEYLNRLIRNNVVALIDVRKNPLSMKYGFSKGLLSARCENIGIEYKHIPQVGIASENRKNLATKSDYDKLFGMYQKEILPTVLTFQMEIVRFAKEYKRIALTCFEADPSFCHRSILAKSLMNHLPSTFTLEHI
jgi:uncharacterized protein (DUF488 family)